MDCHRCYSKVVNTTMIQISTTSAQGSMTLIREDLPAKIQSASPPVRIMEPDRIAALWLHQRYIDRQARYHLIEPFSKIAHGKPIDVPEAEIRRSGGKSATENLVAELELESDPKINLLMSTAHLFEISPWRLPSAREESQLGDRLREVSSGEDGLEKAFKYLDRWYRSPAGTLPDP